MSAISTHSYYWRHPVCGHDTPLTSDPELDLVSTRRMEFLAAERHPVLSALMTDFHRAEEDELDIPRLRFLLSSERQGAVRYHSLHHSAPDRDLEP